jgi:hypothetical protein
MSAAGWYRDPTGRYSIRYWDGQQWTATVNSGGSNTSDPVPEDMRYVAPAPGTEAAVAQSASQQPTTTVTQSSGSSGGTVVAIVLSVVAVLLVLMVLLNQDSEGETETTEPPATTEAPAEE